MTAPLRDPTEADGLVFGLPMAVLALVVLLVMVPSVPVNWSAQTERERLALRLKYERALDGELPVDIELLSLGEGLRRTGYVQDMQRAALLELLWAQRLGVDSLRGLQRVIAAREDLEAALARHPADAYGWMKLALARYLMNDLRPAAAALGASLATRRTDPVLTSLQLDLAVILWDHLPAGARGLVEVRLRAIDGTSALKVLQQSHAVRVLRRKVSAMPGSGRR
jgi:hypothetical protein